MSQTKKYLLLFAVFGMAISCSDETRIFENPEDSIGIEQDRATLSKSINFDTSGVLEIIREESQSNGFARFRNDQAGNYPLTLVATVSPPAIFNGTDLTATDVFIEGDYAYVSYNTVGAVYNGAIDIINISNPELPVLTDRAFINGQDLNAIHFANGFLYVAGGLDAEQSALATDNSFVTRLTVTNGRFDTSGLTTNYQVGFNATDIESMGSSLFVTSGAEGYVIAYDTNSLEVQQEAPYTDLRSIAVNNTNGNLAVLDASVGVRFLNSDLTELSQIPISSDFRAADKRTLAFSGDKIVVSEGDQGAGVYNALTGEFLEHIPIPLTPVGVATSDIVTNAVAFNDDLLLMANGGAGLSIAENNDTMDVVGVIELAGSINFVASKGGYVFAASGREGLQIIELNKPSASLVARCESLPEYNDSAILFANGSTNLALNKPATQIDTGFGGVASRAVDGNTNGNYSEAQSTTHTGRQPNSWWRVDLGDTYDISLIRVYNRTDGCCRNRLNNTEVFVGDVPSDSPLDYAKIGNLNADIQQDFFTNTRGRYVFIRKTNSEFLSLAEVEIYDNPSGTTLNAFKGEKQLNSINVDGSLLLCGIWTVLEGVNISENALFELNGTLIVARNNERRNVTVGSGATLRLEGIDNSRVTIWGDLILEENATLEFIGDNNTITVYGDVIQAESASIRGEFDDVLGKF